MVRLFGQKKERRAEPPGDQPKAEQPPASRVQLTVTQTAADRARRELRLLEVQRDVAQYALTRIFEAEAGGQITQEERDRLAERYKSEMKMLEERIGREQMLVELRELELGQSELVKIFDEKFNELDRRIQAIRVKLGYTVAPQEPQAQAKPAAEPEPESPAGRKPRAPRPPRDEPPKSKAEMEIERLQEEVRKALEKLEQIELEG
ncbi:MAG: hypothetical protein QW057_01480 [Candidatus Bathyarchaeia archaeon]